MAQHEVIVGNIGSVYSGHDEAKAKQCYYAYIELSACPVGSASGESVTWMVDGEVVEEFVMQEDE